MAARGLDAEASAFFPEASLATLNATLEAHGAAVLCNVLNAAECAAFRAQAAAQLERVFVDADRNVVAADPATWPRFRALRAVHGGMTHHFHLSLFPGAFDVRTHPAVVRVFETLWGTRALHGSVDAICIAPPPEALGPGASLQTEKNTWFHTDQRPPSDERTCIQAFVNFNAMGPSDACLSVLRGSHALHGEFFETFGLAPEEDWYMLTPEQLRWFTDRGCEWRRITPLPAGAMVLWDSRTMHMGTLPLHGRTGREPADWPWRIVLYVCYTPASWASEQDYAKKAKALKDGCATEHWPFDVTIVPVLPKQLQGKGAAPERRPYQEPALDARQRKLIGLVRYAPDELHQQPPKPNRQLLPRRGATLAPKL